MTLPVHVAIVVIVEHNGRFLFIEENRGSPQGCVWYFPSGSLDRGESLADAARREVREESGNDIEPLSIVAIDHGVFGDPAGLCWWRFVISARLLQASPAIVEEPDILNVAWVKPEQVASLRLRSSDAMELCEQANAGTGLPLGACRFLASGRLEGYFH